MDRLEDHGKSERLTGFVTNSERGRVSMDHHEAECHASGHRASCTGWPGTKPKEPVTERAVQ